MSAMASRVVSRWVSVDRRRDRDDAATRCGQSAPINAEDLEAAAEQAGELPVLRGAVGLVDVDALAAEFSVARPPGARDC